MNKISNKKIALVGVLAAMSSLLYIFPTFSIFPGFAWLEIDFADVPALVSSLVVSPWAGLVTIFVRNTVHLAISSTMLIGELSNFLISSVFVVSFGFVARAVSKNKKYSLKFVCVSLLIAAVFQIIAAMLVNYFIMIPLYSAFVDFSKIGEAVYIFAGVLPFNAIKDTMTSLVFVLLFKSMGKFLSKYM